MAGQVYIAWIGFQRRPEAMRDRFGYELVYFPPPFRSKLLKPIGYVLQAARTLAVLQRKKPDVVWVQLPPTFVLHALFLVRTLLGAKWKILADSHNASLRPNWINFPGTVALMNRSDAVIAHNSEVAASATQYGVSAEKIRLLETRPAVLKGESTVDLASRPILLVPCSFHDDEPIDALLDAARAFPEADFKVTGDASKAAAKGFTANAPANVQFTGFLSRAEYDDLLKRCTLVIGLTDKPGIQLSAANEATGAGKPMVLSDFAILRELFWLGSEFVENTGEGIAGGCRKVIADWEAYRAGALELRVKREERWMGQARALAAAVGVPLDETPRG